MVRAAFILLALVLLVPHSTDAATRTPNESCELVETPDGFVALRDGPNAGAKLIVQMEPKGAVIPRTDRAGWRRGSWIMVSYWRPGIEFDEALKTGPVGWMNEKLHQGCG